MVSEVSSLALKRSDNHHPETLATLWSVMHSSERPKFWGKRRYDGFGIGGEVPHRNELEPFLGRQEVKENWVLGCRSVVEDLQCSEFESQYSKTNKKNMYS